MWHEYSCIELGIFNILHPFQNFSSPPPRRRGLIICKYLNLVAENVKKSETGGLKDSWQNEPLLTF